MFLVETLCGRIPERVPGIIGGWKNIKNAYFRRLGLEDAVGFHRKISPVDRIALRAEY